MYQYLSNKKALRKSILKFLTFIKHAHSEVILWQVILFEILLKQCPFKLCYLQNKGLTFFYVLVYYPFEEQHNRKQVFCLYIFILIFGGVLYMVTTSVLYMVTTWRSVHVYEVTTRFLYMRRFYSAVQYNIIKCFLQVNACKFTTT